MPLRRRAYLRRPLDVFLVMRIIEVENLLASRLQAMPQLTVAEIVGPWVTGGPAQSASLDLLLVVSVADEESLFHWRLEHLAGAFQDLERDLLRPVDAFVFTRGRFLKEARRGSGLLAAIYSRPRIPLVSSLDEILDPEVAATLAGRALTLEEYGAELRADLDLVPSAV